VPHSDQAPMTEPSPSPTDAVRLNKRMADLKLCSRREADEWIANGWVKVNGRPAEMGVKVTPVDRIEVDKAAKGQQANQVTILINKPIGYGTGWKRPMTMAYWYLRVLTWESPKNDAINSRLGSG